ncbi:hypothetical protein DSO57_1030358 [Entomophthora muscae]|uniref:Uncharacterized protein n=1 Tax=Entomophthora muscae TaxID=34485 RepID=A0ACC2T1F5_9FUNG|nr:hypothetical protein DSO57_1030358 [Entomophthora muscae]
MTVHQIECHLPPLKTQGLGKDLNPGQAQLWAASSRDQGGVCSHFFGIKPPLVQTTYATMDEELNTNLPMILPSKEQKQSSNRGKETPIIDLMSLMSTLVANQNPGPKEGADQKANPKNTALE